MNLSGDAMERFLSGKVFAVVGASRDRSKYGNMVLRAYAQRGRKAYPVNPSAEEVEGQRAYPDLSSLPELPDGISIVTPPSVTERVIDEACRLGIGNVWMQPGSESEDAVRRARECGMNVVAGGPCILVKLGFHDE